jgi:hypothetical protein
MGQTIVREFDDDDGREALIVYLIKKITFLLKEREMPRI